MNERKLNKLFAAARNEIAPVPPEDFAADVLRAARQSPVTKLSEHFSVFEQLNFLFPRVAFAAAALIILCVTADLGLSAAGLPDLSDGTAQVATQFLFNGDNL